MSTKIGILKDNNGNDFLPITDVSLVSGLEDISTIRNGSALGATAYQKPSTGIPASDLESSVQASLGKADTALQSFTETDPTVPSWAKQQNKPSYNYSEIGNTPDLSGFITKSVNDLTNYYLKSETYTKAEVAALIGAIQQFHYEIYATLPQSGESNVLYLIGPTGSGADRYEEYIYANNAFTKIGDTSIDLSGYVTTSALNTALADYATTQDLEDAFDNYPSYTSNEGGVLGVENPVAFINGGDYMLYAVGEDNATGYEDKTLATTDYVDNAIDDSKVFWAEVDVTTFAEIQDAIDAGRTVMLKDENEYTYVLSLVENNYVVFSSVSLEENFIKSYVIWDNDSLDSFEMYNIESQDNKVHSISSSSDGEHYPSAYAVYQALQSYTLTSNLATVATSGSYNDLDDKPTIPSSGDFVTSIGTSGNNITWTKNGTTNNLTVPYATNAEKLNVTSTDNAVVRFDGTGGDIQNSGVTINDSNHVTAAKFITSGGTSSEFVKGDGSLDSSEYLKLGDPLMPTNNFSGDVDKFYLEPVMDCLWAADKRFNTSVTITDSNNNTTTVSSAPLFDGNFGGHYTSLKAGDGSTIKITIQTAEDVDNSHLWGSYTGGYIIVSFYYYGLPSSISARVYDGSYGSKIWKNIIFNKQKGNQNGIYISSLCPSQISIIEITIVCQNVDRDPQMTAISEVEYWCSRPKEDRYPFLNKYSKEKLYYELEAPSFRKTDGTSSQFLKADGSVDSNTYLTQHQSLSGYATETWVEQQNYLTQHQDISGKADKVSNATSGNFAGLDSNGNLVDSGYSSSSFITQHQSIPEYSIEELTTPTSGYRNSYHLKKDGESIIGSDTIDIPNEFTPLVSKEYLDNTFYCDGSANWENSTRLFMSVKPNADKEYWYVKYRVKVWIPTDTDKRFTDSIIEYFGSGITMRCYRIWNTLSSVTTATYYQAAYWLTDAGFSKDFVHLLGTSILYASNYTNSAWYRYVNVDLLAYEGCNVELFDQLTKFTPYIQSIGADASTDYNSYSSYNASSIGLQESGDITDTTNMYLAYSRFTAGTYGIMNRSLIMQDGQGKWQSFTTSSGTAATKTKNPSGFKLGSNVYYMSGTSDYAADDILGTSLVRVFTSLIDFRYSLNVTTTAGGANNLLPYKPLYIVGTIGNDELFYLDNVWWTQDEPTTEDGKIYIKVSPAIYNDYSNDRCYRGDLISDGHAYWFKDGRFKRYYDVDYNDLTNKPTIPAAQIQSDWSQSDNTAKDFIKNKPTIPTVPTNVSAFTNDAGYLTQHQSLSGYATEAWVGQQGYLTQHQDISGKQDKSNLVTSLSASSTDAQYPSAKCVYDLIGDIETLLNAI